MESSRRLRDSDEDSEEIIFFNKPRISRHNTMSRRFFPSSNFTISSTASSPGYTFKDELIDPSTYCFSTALKALQARSGHYNYNNTWECSSSSSPLRTTEGLTLNSKWDEAEKYICNPLSGKVPLECLSSKSLITARSFRYYSSSSSNRITMSAPLVFSSSSSSSHQDLSLQFPIIPPEKKKEGRTRDVGTQSTPPYVSSSSNSPSTPSIMERSIKPLAHSSSPLSNPNTKSDEEDDDQEEEEEKEKEKEETKAKDKEGEVWSKRRQQGGGCFPWACFTNGLFLRNHHKTDKPRKYHNNVFPTTTTHYHFN